MDLDPSELLNPYVAGLSVGLLLIGLGLTSIANAVVQARHGFVPALGSGVRFRELGIGFLLWGGVNLAAAALLLTEGEDSPPAAPLLAATALAQLAFAVPALASAWRGWRMEELGLGRRAHPSGLGTGLLTFGLVAPLLLACNLSWQLLWIWFTGESAIQDVRSLISEDPSSDATSILVLAGLLVPFLEELFFRGILLTWMEARLGAKRALVLSSIIFASLHGPAAFGPIFVLSLVMGAAMLRTRNLLVPFVIHALNNSLLLLFLV